LKTVQPNSFSKTPIAICVNLPQFGPSAPFFAFAVLFKPFVNVLSVHFYVSLNLVARSQWINFAKLSDRKLLESHMSDFPPSPVFLPQQKPTGSLFELAVGCAPRSCMGRIAVASGAYTCFRSDLVELRPCCTLLGRLARQLLLLLDLSASVMVFRPLSTSKWNWPN